MARKALAYGNLAIQSPIEVLAERRYPERTLRVSLMTRSRASFASRFARPS